MEEMYGFKGFICLKKICNVSWVKIFLKYLMFHFRSKCTVNAIYVRTDIVKFFSC